MTRVLILPGNGCTPVESCNWYGWLAQELRARGCEVVLTDMPDPMTALESIWLPHVRDVMKCDENSVIVGHSSGAQAAMRYAETTKVAGLVLVSACVTDLGDENERASRYYNRPWAYDKVRENVSWIVQFGSPDDRFLPAAEQQQVVEGLKAEFHFLKGKDHYMTRREPLILQALVEKLGL
ncbi:putative hydrolase rbbp9 [Aphanomyces cochlioides]|nr:putative hydrolase rbbp9 [Aphanomyces cochlioides]